MGFLICRGQCPHWPEGIAQLFRGNFFQFVNHCAVFGSTADTADIIGIEEAGSMINFYIAAQRAEIGVGVVAVGPVYKGTGSTGLGLVTANGADSIMGVTLTTIACIDM